MSDKNKKEKKENQLKKEETPVSKGEILKSARLKKGLSLEIVHEETKIPMDALRAIEEGYTIRTLSNFYYNGFLKIYAKYLNIDVKKVVDTAPASKIQPVIEDNTPDFDLDEWIKKVFTRKTKQQIVVFVGMFLSLFLIFKLITFFVSLGKGKEKDSPKISTAQKKGEAPVPTDNTVKLKKKSGSQKKSETLSSLSQNKTQEVAQTTTSVQSPSRDAVVTQTKPSSSKTESPKAGQSPKDSAPVQSRKVALTVRATKNSWLRVEVDGQVEFQSTLKLGSVETWFADKEIVISGRNISYLEFELNGKMIGKLGRKERKVKEVTITKDGLQVSK